MKGELVRYGPGSCHIAFLAEPRSKRVVVCIGGLTDGLLALPYLPKLAEVLAPLGWGVANLALSSSYTGWGTSSLGAWRGLGSAQRGKGHPQRSTVFEI